MLINCSQDLFVYSGVFAVGMFLSPSFTFVFFKLFLLSPEIGLEHFGNLFNFYNKNNNNMSPIEKSEKQAFLHVEYSGPFFQYTNWSLTNREYKYVSKQQNFDNIHCHGIFLGQNWIGVVMYLAGCLSIARNLFCMQFP